MDQRTKGIIVTTVAAVLCGCPGLLILLISVTMMTPLWEQVFGSSSPTGLGYVLLCVALIGIMITLAVGVVTLRKRSAPPVDVSGPMPPPA